MNSEYSWTKTKEVIDKIVFQKTGKHLSDVETMILYGSWKGQTYEQIGFEYGYSSEYLNKDVGNKLWSKLSEVIGERVTKKNFKAALERWLTNESVSLTVKELPFPEGVVSPLSPLYIERDNIESLCYATVVKPGSLIRIKAPKLMGKTSLMMKVLAHAQSQKLQTVYLDLNSVNKSVIQNLDKFLRWLCVQVARQLKLENQLDNYWDTNIWGSNDNCTVYLEEYLLPQINCPLVLGLDDIDRLFPYSEVIEDFLGMLRSWHEKGKISQLWQQLRLVVAHSTEIYIPLDINQSPFNAGVPVELLEFNQKQICTLAKIHGLSWDDNSVGTLMEMVCAHPYLVRLAMYEIASGKVTLEKLVEDAPTEAGIYSNHLRRHLQTLQQAPDLAKAMKQVVTVNQPVELNSIHIYKLYSMGLVQGKGNQVIPRCNLYREYFQRVLA